jgi:Ca2+-binding EF-hand superfamily protein
MRQEMLKQFDTNGDGQLDETERAAMRERFGRGMPGQEGGASRTNRQDLMKQFDTNGDGQIDETERAAMRERFNRQPRGEPAPSEPAAR